jgi:uridylate kinase
MHTKSPLIIRYGGSLLVPDQLDVDTLQSFKDLIIPFLNDHQVYIIVGGGQTSRMYQEALQSIGGVAQDQVDWMGIYTIRMNSEFVRIFFGELADASIYNSPDELPEHSDASVIICAALEPGHSSNIDAVEFAQHTGARKILNLSNIDHVYSANPAKNPDAKPFDILTWDAYMDLIPDEFTPKLSVPFDPVAARKARDLGLEVIIMDGQNMDAIQNFLHGKDFVGTRIS